MSDYVTKRISLPGGRAIDIVYFSDQAAAEQPVFAEEDLADGRLHICPECDGDLVYPVIWDERPGDRWQIERRCPDCEWHGVETHGQSEVEVFDDALNDGTEELLRALRSMSHANMEEDVDRMIDALRNDLIEPMDF